MRESVVTHTTNGSVALALTLASLLAGVVLPQLATATPAPGRISGHARVIDGDTLEIDGVRIRLEGIDAPESAQRCKGRWFGTWACGSAATKALTKLVRNHEVICESRGRDVYRRVLAVCHADGVEINARLVHDGLAWAFVRYSRTYVREEADARAAHRGIFAAENQPAWDYRAGSWKTAEQDAPKGCAIKGNISSKGRIYHMPWSPWYHRVSIEPSRGERWFCSEKEAIAAGWRPVHGS